MIIVVVSNYNLSKIFDQYTYFLFNTDWEQAGKQVTINDGGKFFVALGEEVCKSIYGEDIYTKVKADDFFNEKVGDRRQEIVLIGQNLNREEIEQKLDALLISEDDFAKGVEHYSQLSEDAFAPFKSFAASEEEEWDTDDEL